MIQECLCKLHSQLSSAGSGSIMPTLFLLMSRFCFLLFLSRLQLLTRAREEDESTALEVLKLR